MKRRVLYYYNKTTIHFRTMWMLQLIAVAALVVNMVMADDRTVPSVYFSRLRNLPSNKTIEVNNENNITIQCRITVVGTIIDASGGEFKLSDEEEEINCVPIVNGKESNMLYPINLPPNFVKKNYGLIQAGVLVVAITNVRIVRDEKVVVTKTSIISLVGSLRTANTDGPKLDSMGTKTIAIVRISTKDSTPTHDAETIKRTLFNPNTVNLRTQYLNCSYGQLEWSLAPVGVVEVMVDQPVSDFTSGSALVTAAQRTMIDSMGIIDPSSMGDKVIMCLPPGTGSWIASAGVNHWRAQFNDEWCLSLTATMHEVGHLMGLIHSNENGVAYGDSTDYMAAGHKDTDWPRKCFNGYNNWQLGWYKDRELTLDSTFDVGHLVKLASFVDYSRTENDEPVLINIANELYLVFNLARDFNIDTEEKRNEVTITAMGEGGTESLAGLKEKASYHVTDFQSSGNDLVIEVCVRDRGANGAYMMWISIAFENTLCDDIDMDNVKKGYSFDIDVSASPTTSPSQQPATLPPSYAPTTTLPTHVPSTLSPTAEPSYLPSDLPSLFPSDLPSYSPSTTPSLNPTNAPSTRQTKSPISPKPTRPPTTFKPTFTPEPSSSAVFVTLPPTTGMPTPEPKINYKKLLKKRESKIKNSVTATIDEFESLFDRDEN